MALVGVPGELCISGKGVALGYLNKPEKTKESFVKNPFSDYPDHTRMYRTGNIARFLPSGTVDFIGKKDFQVKIRGFRVELTEIEGRIRQHPKINDAVVISHDATIGGKNIVVYIVGDETIDIEELNSFIEDELLIIWFLLQKCKLTKFL